MKIDIEQNRCDVCCEKSINCYQLMFSLVMVMVIGHGHGHGHGHRIPEEMIEGFVTDEYRLW